MINDHLDRHPQTQVQHFSWYDSANRRTTLTLPNGVTVAYTYDNDSRVSGITYTAAGGAQLGNLSYSYDADGRRTAMGGSLAAVNLPATESGNTFNADNGMTGFNGTTLSHDANGNLTSDGTNTYTWDARNQLTGISGGASASFVYDAFGRRVSKTINGATTQFLYDGLNPVQELNGSNPPTPTANLLTGLGIDEYFTRTDSSGTMAFLRDALGSTIALTNSSGAIATQYTYEPFGNTTISGSNTNPYQFTGRENDGRTDLYYYRARYYSPTFQRFIAQDPIGFAGGDTNLYAYTLNNPINLRDLLGLCAGGPTPTPLPTPDPQPNPTPTGVPSPSGGPFISPQFENCLLNAGASPLIIAPIACVATGIACFQGVPLSCRVAAAMCTITGAVIVACAGGTSVPEF